MRHEMISVAMIDPNPHRDFRCNPISEDQVNNIVDSINKTGFWDNIVARPHPEINGRYQLAYGHSRLEAARRCGITQVTLPVADLTDTEMFYQMVLENETQVTITAPMVFENIRAAVKHLETVFNKIGKDGTYEDYCRVIKEKVVPQGTTFLKGGEQSSFTQAHNAFCRDEGIGCKFIQEFIPSKRIHVTVINEVLASFYGLQRSKSKNAQADAEQKKADELKRRADQEKEKRKKADAERKEAEHKTREAELHDKSEEIKARAKHEEMYAVEVAEKAKAREEKERKAAEESQQKADRLRAEAIKDASGHIDEEILKSLPSPTHIREFASAIKGLKIPKKFHQEIATRINAEDISVRNLRGWMYVYWDEQSGNRLQREKDESSRKRYRRLYRDACGGNYEKFLHVFADDLTKFGLSMNVIDDYIDKGSPPARYYPDVKHCAKFADRLEKMIANCRALTVKAEQLAVDLRSDRIDISRSLNGNGDTSPKALPETKS